MTRWQRAAIAGGALAVTVLVTARAEAQGGNYTVNGNPTLLVFDANGNGVIPDAGDCVVTGTGSGNNFALTMTQHMATGAVPLQICAPCDNGYPETLVATNGAQFSGDGFISATMAGAAITDTCLVGLGTPMVSIDARGSTPGPSPSPVSRAAGGVEPLLMPIAGAIFNDEPMERESLGSGYLCSAGGPSAVAIEGRGGLRLLVGLQKVSSGGIDYQCAPVPMPRADTGAIETILSCLPVDSQNKSVLALEGFSLIGIDFEMLASCGGERVPTANEAGLVFLALALAAVGTTVLGRRAAFKQAMPRF